MSMELFASLAKELSTATNVSSVLVGQPFLGEGTHAVRITSIDTADMDQNKLVFTFEDANGHTYVDRGFMTGENFKTKKPEFSYGFRLILSGVLPGIQSLIKFGAATAADPKFVESFTGMSLSITLSYGKGILAKAIPGMPDTLPMYGGYDQESGEMITEAHADTKGVYDEVKARALKRSYLRISGTKCTHKDENATAFDRAIASIPPPKAVSGIKL